jgi:hypothetical protein
MDRAVMKLATLVLAVVAIAATTRAEVLVKLDNPDLDAFKTAGFELKMAGKVKIDAVGLSLKYRDDLNVYSWILNSETREPVWVMKESRSDRIRGSKVLYEEKDDIQLEAGKYELYLYSGSFYFSNISIRGTGDFFDFLGDIFGDRDRRDWEEYLRDCYVELSSDEISRKDLAFFDVTGDLDGALIKYNKLGDSEYIQTGFTLEKPMSIKIYSVFEFPQDYQNPVDYGWIVNADTRDKVWEIDRWNSDWAGGARKNRIYNNEIELDKGNYLLYFVTDDSHSYEEFNANPPYDPINWGIAILPGKNFDPKYFKVFEPADKGEALVDLTRARDDDFMEQPFKLKDKTTLHVYAIGEYSYGSREFVDYGWIQDAATGRIVWEMTYRNTDHAGGAKKNRMFDGQVTLPKGEYIAYYITDDSHSYRDWNDSPPFDPSHWGLAIYPGEGFKSDNFMKLSKSDITKDSNILVKMVMVRDNERHREKFTLDKQTRVHIYALGEGDRDEMYDYGWIIDDRTNRAVWEMTWRNTEPAGGARKNRMFNDDIILDPGTYEVYYVSDGSHSFNDWNAARPSDAVNWGITISVVD